MLVDSPLLSYIDIRPANFLPPSLTTGETQDLGPCYTTAEDLALVKNESVKRVSRSHKAHIPIERPNTPAQVAEAAIAEPANPEAEANLEDMVMRRTLSIDHFLPNTRLASQPQQPLTWDRTPPLPFGHAKKKQRVGDPPLRVPSDQQT